MGRFNFTLAATFADDTAILTSDLDPRRGSEKLYTYAHSGNTDCKYNAYSFRIEMET
jgi:hypothetical protein